MATYTRITQQCSFAELRPEIRETVLSLAEQRGLGDIAGQIHLCAQTTSKKAREGLLDALFGGDPEPFHTTAVMVTPEWLIWVRWGEKPGAAPMLARLQEVEVHNYLPPLPQIQDAGLEVVGRIGDLSEQGTAFIRLGDNPAGRDFGNQVITWATLHRV